jgi:mono/diheme cytochrome c family protein
MLSFQRRGVQAPRFFASQVRRAAYFCIVACAVASAMPAVFAAEDLPSPDKTAGVDLRDPQVIAKGTEMLNSSCGGYCHGPGVRGGKGPALRNRTDLSTSSLHTVISYGRKRAGKLMPGWKGVLTEEQIWSVIAAIVALRDAPTDGDAQPAGGGRQDPK